MILRRGSVFVVLLSLISAMVFCGCNSDGADISSAEYGLIYTTEYDDKTEIHWLDDQLKEIGITKYGFSGATLDGFRNMCHSDNGVFLVPEGQADRRDYGKALCISVQDGTVNSFDYDRVNPTGYDISGKFAAIVSNLNDKCFIDCINMDTSDVVSMNCPEGTIVYEIIYCNDDLYGIALDGAGAIHLCKCDVSKSRITNLMEIEDDEPPGFLQTNGSKIFFIAKNKLVCFDTGDNSYNKMELSRESAFNLRIANGNIWIAYTDIFSPESDSYVERIDLENMKVLYSQKIIGPVLQIEDDGNRLMIRGYDKLQLFEYDQGGLYSINEVSCHKKGYFVGGCFSTRGGRQ